MFWRFFWFETCLGGLLDIILVRTVLSWVVTSAGSIENYENDVVEVIVDALFVENFEKIIGDD